MTCCSMSKVMLAGLTVGIAAAEVPAAAPGDVFEGSCCQLLGWKKDPHADACGFAVPSARSLPYPVLAGITQDLQKARLTPASRGELGRSKRSCRASSRSVLISAFLNHRRGFVCGISTMRFRN